jgi:hypothetical protein
VEVLVMEREKKLTPVPVRCAPLALAAAACLRADRSEPAGAAARAAAGGRGDRGLATLCTAIRRTAAR